MKTEVLKYSLGGGLIGGLGFGGYNILIQLEEKPESKIDWEKVRVQAINGALLGLAIGTVIGLYVEEIKSNIHIDDIDLDEAFRQKVEEIKLDKNNPYYKILSQKADRLIQILRQEYQEVISKSTKYGSSEENTALADNFDIDINIEFKAGSFKSIPEMLEGIHDFLLNDYIDEDSPKVREQTSSIGLIYKFGRQKLKIDIVPSKLIDKPYNQNETFIPVQSKSFWNGTDISRTKTNVNKLKKVRLSEEQKNIILIFKYWKNKYNIPIPSHLLKHLILETYKKNHMPKRLDKKCITVAKFIYDNIFTIRLTGIENTNNILTDLSNNDKSRIESKMKKIINTYYRGILP